MKKVVTASFECEICGRAYASSEEAAACESYPPPALSVGDVVIWSGRRDDLYGARQSLVIDRVAEVVPDRRHGRGTLCTTVLRKTTG